MDHITVAEVQKFTTVEAAMVRTQEAFFEFCAGLLTIRDERLYRASYPTFEEYCLRRWGMGRQRAYQLIDATQVIENLSTMVDIPMPTNERQTRALASLAPDQQREVWAAAIDSALNGQPTAAHIEHTAQAKNYKRDTRRTGKADTNTSQPRDACQTPAYAIDPLLPYLGDWVIWEPAAGDGILVQALYDSGFRQSQVVYGDILTGQNFFEYEPDRWDCIVTNPPYSTKYKFLERCYSFGKPFALLLPVDVLGVAEAQRLFKQHQGLEIIFIIGRVGFQTVNTSFADSRPWFASAWFTHGLCVGEAMSFVEIKADAL